MLLSLSQVACAAERATSPAPEVRRLANEAPKRILFVGNSYLYYNDSLHNHVSRIAAEVGPYDADDYKYKSATIGGARLSHHNIDSLLDPGRLGIDEPFELVILQGGSGEVLTARNRARFRESAIEMSEKIRATGAEVALYMTHAYVAPDKRYEPNLLNDKIQPTYVAVGNELNALVIPVGLAFERAYKKRPDIVLHKTFDGTHPSLLGTYLAACVVYQSVYGSSTVGIEYDYFGAIDAEDARFLQQIADESVREFFSRD
ncbi:MAG: SGNH/GDSL hydrolase family protein [Woeseiaceae bacterium]|nr:SGNH/GDSL hydrolase family protein [Woeseiaceae bacterium]